MPHAAICWCNHLMNKYIQEVDLYVSMPHAAICWCNPRHALPAPPMGRNGGLESHAFFCHAPLTQEKHTLQNHDVNPCFPFCDTVYTNLESANDRIQLCRSIAALSIFPAP